MNLRCETCVWYRRTEEPRIEDGEAFTVIQHFCEDTVMTEAQATFGCGLYKERKVTG